MSDVSLAATRLTPTCPVPLTAAQTALGYTSRAFTDWIGDAINVKFLGARGDGKIVKDGTITVSSTTVTSPTASFSASDIGKVLIINDAGAAGANLVTTIAAVTNSTTITVSAAPSTGVTPGEAVISWGTDDTAAINRALALTPTVADVKYSGMGGTVLLPPGHYIVTGTLTVKSFTRLKGSGSGATIINARGMTTGDLFTFSNLFSSTAFHVHMDGLSAFGPGRASGVNGFNSPLCRCRFESAYLSFFAVAFSLGALGSENTFVHCRASESRRGVYLGNGSTTARFYACSIDTCEQGLVLDGALTTLWAGGVIQSIIRSTSLTDGNVAVLGFGAKVCRFEGTHFENTSVDVKLDVRGITKCDAFTFTGCLFDPPNNASAHIQIVNAYFTRLESCWMTGGTAQYIQLYTNAIWTQIDNLLTNQTNPMTWGFRDDAGSIVDISSSAPPGTWTTILRRAINGAANWYNPVNVSGGARSAPAFSFIGDTDTGVYRIGADVFGIACGGAKIVQVDSTGITITGGVNATGELTAAGGLTLSGGTLALSPGVNLQSTTTTGTKIGTGVTQKLGFWNATPVVQQTLATGAGATVDNVISMLQTIGLCKQS